MAKKIVAVNASPRAKWNTAQLVREAAAGAEGAGAEVEVEGKQRCHDEVFPDELARVRKLAAELFA